MLRFATKIKESAPIMHNFKRHIFARDYWDGDFLQLCGHKSSEQCSVKGKRFWAAAFSQILTVSFDSTKNDPKQTTKLQAPPQYSKTGIY